MIGQGLVLLAMAMMVGDHAACTHDIVRTAKSRLGAVATEELRFCAPSSSVVTGQNEIFIQTKGHRSNRVLVARLESVGRTGVPLTWTGKTLVIHIPPKYKQGLVQILHHRVGDVSLVVAKDYSEKQMLRDSEP